MNKLVAKHIRNKGDRQVTSSVRSINESSSWGKEVFSSSSVSKPSTISDIKVSKWSVSGSLRVTSSTNLRNWKMMEKILDHILDYYDGNLAFKPIILLFYWLFGINLNLVPGPINKHSWGVDFGEPIEIKHRLSLIGEQSYSYHRTARGVYRGCNFIIDFSIKLTPTRRQTVTVMALLKLDPALFKDRKKFSEILTTGGVSHTFTEADGLIILEQN
ncbi:matrix protein [Mononegavirales sp.]|nr:matrix protein [Mononegavirales sp.]